MENTKIEKATEQKNFEVQINLPGSEANAQDFALKVKKAGFPVTIKTGENGPVVQVGGLQNEKNSKEYMAKVKKAGFDAVLVQG